MAADQQVIARRCRLSFSSALTASAEVSLVARSQGQGEVRGTRSTYAWPLFSKNARLCVQLP